MKVIKTHLDSKGDATIRLYGKEFVISKDKFDNSGKAKFSAFGEGYVAQINNLAKKQRTSAKVKAIVENKEHE